MKRILFSALCCLMIVGCVVPASRKMNPTLSDDRVLDQRASYVLFSMRDVRNTDSKGTITMFNRDGIFPLSRFEMEFAKLKRENDFKHDDFGRRISVSKVGCNDGVQTDDNGEIIEQKYSAADLERCDFGKRMYFFLKVDPGDYALKEVTMLEGYGFRKTVEYNFSNHARSQWGWGSYGVGWRYNLGKPGDVYSDRSVYFRVGEGKVVYAGDIITYSTDRANFRMEVESDVPAAKSYLVSEFGQKFADKLSVSLIKSVGN